jgi:hypothetical protein
MGPNSLSDHKHSPAQRARNLLQAYESSSSRKRQQPQEPKQPQRPPRTPATSRRATLYENSKPDKG